MLILEKIVTVLCTVVMVVVFLGLFVYLPVGLNTAARCYAAGASKAKITWNFNRYCEGSVKGTSVIYTLQDVERALD